MDEDTLVGPFPPEEDTWNLSFLERFRVHYLPTDRYGLLVSITRTGVRPNGTADYDVVAEFEGAPTPITATVDNFELIYQAE